MITEKLIISFFVITLLMLCVIILFDAPVYFKEPKKLLNTEKKSITALLYKAYAKNFSLSESSYQNFPKIIFVIALLLLFSIAIPNFELLKTILLKK